MVSGTETNGRQADGRFANGNAGGPGRPRRAVETEYLATLGDAVSLDDWRQVVRRAVDDAKNGDAKARAWLTKHLIEGAMSPLYQLALAERRGQTVDDQIDKAVGRAGTNSFRPGVH